MLKKIAILNSGGPEMEIIKYTKDGVVCQWFDDDNICQQELFKLPTVCVFNQVES